MKKFIAIVMSLVLIASVAMLAGCGKKDDVKAAKVIGIDLTNENYAFGVDKAQPELLEKTNAFIDKILSNGTFDEICSRYSSGGEPVLVKSAAKDSSKDQLVVATNAAFEPFEYTVGDSYAGIDMEIAKLLADELGKELVIDNMDFDAVCLSVGQHKCDIAMAGLTRHLRELLLRATIQHLMIARQPMMFSKSSRALTLLLRSVIRTVQPAVCTSTMRATTPQTTSRLRARATRTVLLQFRTLSTETSTTLLLTLLLQTALLSQLTKLHN